MFKKIILSLLGAACMVSLVVGVGTTTYAQSDQTTESDAQYTEQLHSLQLMVVELLQQLLTLLQTQRGMMPQGGVGSPSFNVLQNVDPQNIQDTRTSPVSKPTLPTYTSPHTGVEKPNVIFIMLDDLGYGSLGSYGSDFVRTPHIDGVASEGMKFTQYYANAPICSPTRAALLSGAYQSRVGYRRVTSNMSGGIPEQVLTLPELFKQEGYSTGHIGKWHVGLRRDEFKPNGVGFDESIIREDVRTYTDVPLSFNGGSYQASQGHLTDVLTDHAIDFLTEHKDERFFLNLWHYAPHQPIADAAPEWKAQYPNTNEGKYAALVSHADAAIGRLLDHLETLGLSDETLVVITSDNGGYQLQGRYIANAPFVTSGKSETFEGGIRVPMIVRWPGMVAPDTANNSLVMAHDFFPTFADIFNTSQRRLMEGGQMKTIDGESFLPMLTRGIEQKRTNPVIWEHRRRSERDNYAVRDGDWKFVFDQGRRFLFNLGQDPYEQNNVITSHSSVAERFEKLYSDWRLETGVVEHKVGQREGAVTGRDDVFTFAEAGGRVTLEKDQFLNINTRDFTFSTWLWYPEGAFDDTFGTIGSKQASWELFVQQDNTVSFAARIAGTREPVTVRSSRGLTPDIWNHVAFVSRWDTDHTDIELYINGDHAGTVNLPRYMRQSDFPLFLGNRAFGDNPFVGSLAGIQMYLPSLTQEELTVVAEATRPDGVSTVPIVPPTKPPSTTDEKGNTKYNGGDNGKGWRYYGEEWSKRISEKQVAASCTLHTQCARGSVCHEMGTIIQNTTSIGAVMCADTTSVGAAWYQCTENRVGELLRSAQGAALACCAETSSGYRFEAVGHGACR